MPDKRSEEPLADRVAEVVLRHPSVVRLDGGPLGMVATHLPGRRVTGVRAGDPGEPVEVSVVLTFGEPVAQVTAALRASIHQVAGAVPVHITVSDVVEADDSQKPKVKRVRAR